MTRRLAPAVVMFVAGVALLTAAAAHTASGQREAGDVRKGGTLRIAAAEVGSLDPALAYSRDSWQIQDATCARLFGFLDTGQGRRLVPEVAAAFPRVSRDGRTYTFDLKQRFRFHTGASVTAQSFADALNRVALPKLRSPAAAYMRDIVGATAVIDGREQSISGVRVIGRFRLQIRLTKELGDLPARLVLPFFCPILPNTPTDPAGIDNPAGSGPYYVAEHVANRRTILKRNPHYGGNRPANVDEIVLTTGEGVDDCLLAVEEDRVDWCGGPGARRDGWRTLVERYGVNRPGGRLFVAPSLATVFLAFNHDRPAFRGPGQIPLKKAINYAIDRPALVRSYGYLAGKRTDQLLPPALARAASIYPLRGANYAAARRWYAQASIKPTGLVLYASSIAPALEAAKILRFNLAQIDIDLEVKHFASVAPDEDYDIVIAPWAADYPDGAGFLVPLLGPGVASGVNFDDARFERRIQQASRLAGEARAPAWADLDASLMRENPPAAAFMHPQFRILVSRSVGCVAVHPIYGLDLAAVCKK